MTKYEFQMILRYMFFHNSRLKKQVKWLVNEYKRLNYDN